MRPSISTLDGFTSRCSTPCCVHARSASPRRVGEPDEVGAGDRALLAHVVVEREARHVAGGDVRDVAPRVGVDDLGHPRLRIRDREPTSRASRSPGLVVADDVRAQHLQRDPRPAGALGEVDHAHAALADAGEQVVAADREPGTGPDRRPALAAASGRGDGRHAVELPASTPPRVPRAVPHGTGSPDARDRVARVRLALPLSARTVERPRCLRAPASVRDGSLAGLVRPRRWRCSPRGAAQPRRGQSVDPASRPSSTCCCRPRRHRRLHDRARPAPAADRALPESSASASASPAP